MRPGPLIAIVAAITLFLNVTPAKSQVALKYVLIPTGEIQFDWQELWRAKQHVWPTQSVEAYAQTTNEVLQAWCNDISFQRDAMTFATTTIMGAGITNCPSADSNEIIKIIVPSSQFSSQFGARAPDEVPESINIYLRSNTPAGRDELFSLAKPYLSLAYPANGEYFTPDGFFPNFCLMCGCCYKPNGGITTEQFWTRMEHF